MNFTGTNLLWLGAAGTAIAAGWQYIRMIWSYISGLAVGGFGAHGYAAACVRAALRTQWLEINNGSYYINMLTMYDRDTGAREATWWLARYGTVSFFCRWRSWWPQVVAAHSKDGAVHVYWIRGLFDSRRFIREAFELQRETYSRVRTAHVMRGFVVHTGTAQDNVFAEIDRPRGNSPTEASSPRPNSNPFELWHMEYETWPCLTHDKDQLTLAPTATDQHIWLSAEGRRFVAEFERWHNAREWYRRHGIPWRRAWELCGPPGNGKTTLARAMANRFSMTIHYFVLSTMTNKELRQAWQDATREENVIILFEELDRVFVGREAANDKIKVTFDEFLQVLDGVEQNSGLAVIITTNRPELFDAALSENGSATRPGRIDSVIRLENPTEAGRRAIIKSILAEFEDEVEPLVALTDGQSCAQAYWKAVGVAEQRFWNSTRPTNVTIPTDSPDEPALAHDVFMTAVAQANDDRRREEAGWQQAGGYDGRGQEILVQ